MKHGATMRTVLFSPIDPRVAKDVEWALRVGRGRQGPSIVLWVKRFPRIIRIYLYVLLIFCCFNGFK